MSRLRLISWNIAGRVQCNPQQVALLGQRQPDLVALQEVRANASKKLFSLFSELGLVHLLDNTEEAEQYGRVYGELVASRWPLSRLPDPIAGNPFPERVLSLMVASPWGQIELHIAHIVPGVSNGWKKIEMFEHLYQQLARGCELPRILCGDFNSPQAETPEGRLITWGERIGKNGEITIARGDERWDAGERSVLKGLAEHDLPDVFRGVNGYGVEAYSWFSKRNGEWVSKRRFDHIFASERLNQISCEYLMEGIERGLSDHAAIEAVFEPKGGLL
jgi:exonuclease III